MIRHVPKITVACLLGETLLILVAFVSATYLLSDVDPTDYLVGDAGRISIPLVALAFVAALYFQNLYSDFHVKSRVLLFQQLCMITGVVFLLQGLIGYANRDLGVPLAIMVTGSIIATAIIYGERLLISVYAIDAIAKTELLLVGSSPILEELDGYIKEHPQAGLLVAGYVDDGAARSDRPVPEFCGNLTMLRDTVSAKQPARIVLGLTTPADAALTDDLLQIRYSGYDIDTAANAYERICGRVSVYDLDLAQVTFRSEYGTEPQAADYRQLLSRSIALLGIILTLPFSLITALALWATQGRPIFERKRLVGRNGREFNCRRFRLQRTTRLGALIDRLRLDSLPQLINVLKGEMNLVGPRPDRPEYAVALERYIPYYRERFAVPPGMTGWAQIHWVRESAATDVIRRLEYDMYYIRNRSVSLDLLILLHTVKVMLASEGLNS